MLWEKQNMIVDVACWFVCPIFQTVVKVGFIEKVTFEQTLGEDD